VIYVAEQRDIFQCNVVSVDRIALTVYSTVERSCKYHHQHDKTTGNWKKWMQSKGTRVATITSLPLICGFQLPCKKQQIRCQFYSRDFCYKEVYQ